MGNGFTFELETAVFLSIILAVRNLRAVREPLEALVEPGKDVYVYGDDLIIPTDYAQDVISALTYCGFSINKEKSFTEGHFRESCGGDYFKGVDVRPYFMKKYPTEPQDWIGIANGIRRMAVFTDDLYPLRGALLRPWFAALDSVPAHIRRLRGPERLGDLVVHDGAERWQTRKRGNVEYIRTYRPAKFRRISWTHWKPDVQLATALYGTGDGRNGITPRDAVIGYKIGWVPYSSALSQWLPPLLEHSDVDAARVALPVKAKLALMINEIRREAYR